MPQAVSVSPVLVGVGEVGGGKSCGVCSSLGSVSGRSSGVNNVIK